MLFNLWIGVGKTFQRNSQWKAQKYNITWCSDISDACSKPFFMLCSVRRLKTAPQSCIRARRSCIVSLEKYKKT